MSAGSTAEDRRGWRLATLVALGLWGAIHVLGGLSLVIEANHDGGGAALESLAGSAAPEDLPTDPGPVVEGVLAFHGADIAAAGLAVLWVAVITARRRWPIGVGPALLLVAVLDLGLVAFLVAPGHTPWSDGVWGPLLLGGALASALLAGWRPGRVSAGPG